VKLKNSFPALCFPAEEGFWSCSLAPSWRWVVLRDLTAWVLVLSDQPDVTRLSPLARITVKSSLFLEKYRTLPVALPDAIKYERIIELITFCSRYSLVRLLTTLLTTLLTILLTTLLTILLTILLTTLPTILPTRLPTCSATNSATYLIVYFTSLLASKHASKHASCDAFEYTSFASWSTP